MNESKIIDSIDFFKFFACLGVVFIHCEFGGYPQGELFRAWGRVGVPFFFVVSGFFCFSSIGKVLAVERKKVLKKIWHITRLSLGAILFYAFFHFISFCVIGNSSIKNQCSDILSYQKLLVFLVQNSPFQYSHLWFLFALLYCYTVVLVVGNLIKGQWKVFYILLSVTVFFFVSELLPMKDCDILLFDVIKPKCLFVLRALPFFFLGMLLKENEEMIQKARVTNRTLFIGVLLGFIFATIERFTTLDSQFYFGTYITVVSIYIYCIKNPKSISKKIEWLGRNSSLHIYITHIAVYYVLNSVFKRYHILYCIYRDWCPLIVFVVTLIMSLIYIFCKDSAKKFLLIIKC